MQTLRECRTLEDSGDEVYLDCTDSKQMESEIGGTVPVQSQSLAAPSERFAVPRDTRLLGVSRGNTAS